VTRRRLVVVGAGITGLAAAFEWRRRRPDDEIVAFDVFWVRDQCPRPGDLRPYNNETVPILSYRRPSYQPRPGLPPLPPALKERSAEKAKDEKKDDKSKVQGVEQP